MFNAVICCHPKDFETLPLCTEGIRDNIPGCEDIYVVSKADPVLDGVHWVDESSFPFTYADIAPYTTPDRTGWYFQQLLKMYSVGRMPSDAVLIVDADTVFMKPTPMIQEGKYSYGYGTEYHMPYFEHMRLLHPSLHKVAPVSGICHHMLMERKRIEEIFALVEGHHGKAFWRAFMDMTIASTSVAAPSGASEYEIYFSYLFSLYPNDYVIRPLEWKNSGDLARLDEDRRAGYNYVSYHAYMRS